MTPIVFRPAAQIEFDQAATWYENQRVGLGSEFVARIREVLQTIAENPSRFATVEGDIREAPVSRFPYYVYYRVRQTRVVIIAVFHTSRNPATWQRRG